ncbi:GM12736 [Drosophila sechellia]|uniref:GM12736 n=1 Tax=Drosophila sechellia TaxID=7238 RepID=B4HZ15_DROSE|nr:GM12736 [Drosophila sechellia]
MGVKIIILVLVSLFNKANGSIYELSVADEEIFSSCSNPEPGTLDIHGLFDLSEFSTSMDADALTVSGNQTLMWDIQRGDRVQLFYFDRGTWTSTAFSIYSNDFCKNNV